MLKRKEFGIAAAAAATLVALSACNNPQSETQTFPGTSTASSSTAPSVAAHNDADVAFTKSMIPHHRQAVVMSDIQLAKPAIDPRIITLAHQIKAAQSAEIEQMMDWLDEWGASTSPPSTMPMSEQDMAALQDAQGANAGRLYLTQMIQHHEGAVMMAQPEIRAGQFSAAVTMARSIVSAQERQIVTMTEMRNSL